MAKFLFFFLLPGLSAIFTFALGHPINGTMQIDYVQISQDFLYAAKTGNSTSGYIDTLSKANEDALKNQLDDDNKRLAFWLNIYNGFTQVILKKDPDLYITRNSFFSSRQIGIAGRQLSLDDIEHGILRRSKIKWSLGYLGKLSPSGFEKKFRVEKLDYRIHFALNCGAKSCPPIAFYDAANIDKQLTLATKVYLKGECEYDAEKNAVNVPVLMSWFRGDFSGKKNMLVILEQLEIIPKGSNPKVIFKKYDWDLYLNNYKAENNG